MTIEQMEAAFVAEQTRHATTVIKWMRERAELTDELVKVRRNLQDFRDGAKAESDAGDAELTDERDYWHREQIIFSTARQSLENKSQAQAAEIKHYREALRPFAAAHGTPDPHRRITLHDLRVASETLARHPQEEK